MVDEGHRQMVDEYIWIYIYAGSARGDRMSLRVDGGTCEDFCRLYNAVHSCTIIIKYKYIIYSLQKKLCYMGKKKYIHSNYKLFISFVK